MRNQTSEAFAYIERECNDVKGRVELQRRVVEQLHIVQADAGEAEASLNALLDDEALSGSQCDDKRAPEGALVIWSLLGAQTFAVRILMRVTCQLRTVCQPCAPAEN
jgi:hypothetical protein